MRTVDPWTKALFENVFSFLLVQKSRGVFEDYCHYNGVSEWEWILKIFLLKANKRRKLKTIYYLLSLLFCRYSPQLCTWTTPNRDIASTQYSVFMKTLVSKRLQWIYIWYKLCSASQSFGNVPLHKLSVEVCPPSFHTADWLICSLMASCIGQGLRRTSVRVDWACWVCIALLRSSAV